MMQHEQSEQKPDTVNPGILTVHEHIREKFISFEFALNALQFASIVEGDRGTWAAINANKDTLNEATKWLPRFCKQMIDGWLLRQRAPQLESKGETVLLRKLNSRTIAHHVDAASERAELGFELSRAQFMALVTLGMLAKMKSVNYTLLHRTHNLGGDTDIANRRSFWMFNWQPETVHSQLKWLESTGQVVLEDPFDLVKKYPEQFLRFAHFISAFVIAGEVRSANFKRTFTRKKAQNDLKSTKPFHILLPHGMTISPPPVQSDIESDPFTYNGTVPGPFSELIEGMELDL